MASLPTTVAPRKPAFSWRSISVSTLTWAFCLAFFGPFLIYPVFQVVLNALTDVNFQTGTRTLHLSLLWTPLQNVLWRQSIINSAVLGVATTILASLIALPLAFAAARLSFRGKALLTGLLLVPLLLPPLVGAIGLKQVLSPEGFVNTLLGAKHHVDFFGSRALSRLMVVFVEAFHLYPLIYLNVSAAWANIDSSLEEAAENQGASAWRVFFTVTLPLLLPGFLAGALIVFVFGLTDLGTPQIFNVLDVAAVKIFQTAQSSDPKPEGYVLALYLVVLSGLIFWISRRFLDGGKIATLARGTRRARETRPAWPLLILTYAFFFVVIGLALLPHFGVIVASLAHDWTSSGDGNPWPEWTTHNFRDVFTDNSIPARSAIKVSLLCAAASMTIDVIGGFFLAYALVRGRVWAKGFLDTLAMLPLALPGLILAFGLLISFRDTPLYPLINPNPLPLLILSYAVRRFPYALRSVSAGLAQTSVALEEASLNMGATPIKTMWQITRPLVTANLIAAGLLTFAFAVLEVSDSLIIATQKGYQPIAQAIFNLQKSSLPYHACALGVVGMLLLTATFLVANKVLGKQLGALFRA